MKSVFIGVPLILLLALVPSVAAKTVTFVESASVSDKPQITLDPSKAYILVRSDVPVPLHLMRMASAEDQRVYDGLRADALIKAREKYTKKRAAYEQAKQTAAKQSANGQRLPMPEEPVEPTEANFQFTPFGLMAGVQIGPTYRFAKQPNGGSTYLQAVTPGTYRIYGPMIPALPKDAVCFCMGSVRFEARAGEIVDLGMIVAQKTAVVGGEADLAQSLSAGFRIEPVAGDAAVDPRLKAATIRPADYRPVGKLPNYFGVAVGRLPEIPGVMRYERDRIVDLTGGR